MSFYNTTSETGQRLKEYTRAADSQEEALRTFAARFAGTKHSADEWRKLLIAFNIIDKNVPTTSIRRACTNLFKEGALQKHTEKKIGEYGRPCHLYGIPTN